MNKLTYLLTILMVTSTLAININTSKQGVKLLAKSEGGKNFMNSGHIWDNHGKLISVLAQEERRGPRRQGAHEDRRQDDDQDDDQDDNEVGEEDRLLAMRRRRSGRGNSSNRSRGRSPRRNNGSSGRRSSFNGGSFNRRSTFGRSNSRRGNTFGRSNSRRGSKFSRSNSSRRGSTSSMSSDDDEYQTQGPFMQTGPVVDYQHEPAKTYVQDFGSYTVDQDHRGNMVTTHHPPADPEIHEIKRQDSSLNRAQIWDQLAQEDGDGSRHRRGGHHGQQ